MELCGAMGHDKVKPKNRKTKKWKTGRFQAFDDAS
jgi:hypothetical protein